ncbi:DNA replication ATPase [Rhizodiscina lignyota]|uniref:DNA replication ATPase n=1 Tax=Rhizodiscina lignyota TaxID=1504668 RepID=A0A9P4IDN0_9PEZI|nr:DNA replication ATPase [Rhizodiscina lignyota]
MVDCPVCGKQVKERDINAHLDSGCQDFVAEANGAEGKTPVASFFQTPTAKKTASNSLSTTNRPTLAIATPAVKSEVSRNAPSSTAPNGAKRPFEELQRSPDALDPAWRRDQTEPAAKKSKTSNLQKVAPLADRMRPRSLNEVYGQELVGPNGIIRGLVEQDRVPSMVLWGGPGTGKTTIARLIAHSSNSRFVEINSTSSGVGECKKLFAQALSELQLTGRKTIIFCDEIHRFSKSQQDVFLGPVEAGLVTLIGATTENPSFKVISALLSRCRVFTLAPLSDQDIVKILKRALDVEVVSKDLPLPPLLSGDDGEDVLLYLATSASGDGRTALNLLELALSLSEKPDITLEQLKTSLTHTLIYDRQGDAHYDTISALHKSIRGSDPHASLYYLARMIESGEDPLYIARRLIVVASEDVGLADNTMLPLAVATHDAVQKIGLPEAKINLAHCVTALALSPKSTRAYRGLNNAMAAVQDPKTAGLPIPLHLRNAPTRLMKEIGYGADYKYNPDYVDGKVKQEYFPEALRNAVFLEDRALGTNVDPDLADNEENIANNPTSQTINKASAEEIVSADQDLTLDDSAVDPVDNLDAGQINDTASAAEFGDDEDLWEQDESGMWAVRKSSQAASQ